MEAYDGEPIRLAVAELTRFLGAGMDDLGFLADPHRCLTPRVRSRPVHRLPSGALVVLGYAACSEVLRDTRFGHGAGDLYETTLLGLPARSFLQLDPPGHTRLRGQVARHFSVRRIQSLVQSLARYSTALVHGCAGRPGDFVTDFAEPLALTVISDVLGVPPEERVTFQRDARLVIQGLDQPARVLDERALAQARFRFVRYFRRQVQARRQEPRDDLVSLLLCRPDGSRADIREVVTSCSLLLSAGYDTTVSLLSHAAAELGGAPSGQGWTMIRNSQTVDAVVEEVLRLQSPVQIAPRAAVRDTVLDGLPVARGTIVLPLLAAANRDPDVFDAPHAFRPGRYLAPPGTGQTAARHLAFGAGAHFCLGAALARTTARSALSVLTACPPRLRNAPRTYHEGVVVRGMRSLQVTWPDRPSEAFSPSPADGAAAHAAPSCPVSHA
ncbi:cytochrome P450 [Streptomyces chrestomyceticus]|uniref:cytochrome P450 n=1 Tax=Streptomyces chrestomyceticus TaxID=68185 RepID=UPI0019D1B622|nr:cytochrome P450 [Streptomyces chrestomyceticus]